jgi:hypothetical protein
MNEHMITLCGQVANAFVQPGGTSKKTGESFDPRDKVQILGQLPLPAGGYRLDLVTLNVENAQEYSSLVGQNIRVPVGVYAVGKSVGYFIPQGSKPVVLKSQQI